MSDSPRPSESGSFPGLPRFAFEQALSLEEGMTDAVRQNRVWSGEPLKGKYGLINEVGPSSLSQCRDCDDSGVRSAPPVAARGAPTAGWQDVRSGGGWE